MTTQTPATRRVRLAGALLGPFVLQAVLLIVGHELTGAARQWTSSGVIPLLAGFILLEREYGIKAAWQALLYVPVMFWLLVMFSLMWIGLVYGAFL